ncbi:MAG TPA: hypothetical protein VFS43_25230 [Polyangiaceae bacterium]|nr:hypothetical protein [Polyangiaceae bacterium]
MEKTARGSAGRALPARARAGPSQAARAGARCGRRRCSTGLCYTFENDVERLGIDPDRALVIVKNGEGCMIALDYRVDPPAVVSTERHISGRFVWRRLASDFDEFMTGSE